MADDLPSGDVVFIRQVIQHLSSADITQAIGKLAASFRYFVLTEHLPRGAFTANLDRPSDEHIRTGIGSGIVVTLPPFNLPVKDDVHVLEILCPDGVIRTNIYRLR